jgi:hypothetical protein
VPDRCTWPASPPRSRRQTPPLGNSCGRRYAFRDATQRRQNVLPRLVLVRANGELPAHVVRDDVGFCSAVDGADRHHGGIERRLLSADDRLNGMMNSAASTNGSLKTLGRDPCARRPRIVTSSAVELAKGVARVYAIFATSRSELSSSASA